MAAERTRRVQLARSACSASLCVLFASVFALFASVFAFGVARAQAQPHSSSLSWVRLEGAESCIAGPDLARAVEARLGRTVFATSSSAELSVEGRAERVRGRTATRWSAVLRITNPRGEIIGERVVESRADSCDELSRLATVAIALMIDPLTPAAPTEGPAEHPAPAPSSVQPTESGAPESTPEAREAQPAPEVRTAQPAPEARTAQSAPEPREAQPAPEARAATSDERWRFEVDGSLFAALGVVPGLGLGGQSAFFVDPPHFVPLVLEGSLVPFARLATSTAQIDFLRVMGGVQVCPLAWRPARLALLGCLGVDVGALFVLDTNVALREREKVLAQGHAALRLHWQPIGPLVVRVGLHLLVPFRAVSFVRADTGEDLYAPGVVAGMLDLGLGVRW